MARRATHAEIENRTPLPKPPRRGGPHSEMLARGRAHELHAVGPIGPMGARASACGIYGSFYEAPPGPEFPKCPVCFGEVRR